MINFSNLIVIILSIAALILFFLINKQYFKYRKTSETITKYGNIYELSHSDLINAKAKLLEVGVDGKSSEYQYLIEERVYSSIVVILVISAVSLAANIIFGNNPRILGKVSIAIFLILIAGKFYELYRTSKINKFLSKNNRIK